MGSGCWNRWRRPWGLVTGCVLAALVGVASGCDQGKAPPEGEAPGGVTMPYRAGFVATQGYRVLVREFGRPDGPPVLLIHGFMRNGWSFTPLLEALGAHYRLIVPDLPGHGETYPEPVAAGAGEAPPPFRILAPAVVAVADQLGIDRFAILGHSLGGVVGAQVALAHPERVTALVLLESTPALRWEKAHDCHPACQALLAFEDNVIAVNRKLHGRGLYDALWKEYMAVDATAVLARADLPLLWLMNTDKDRSRDDFLRFAGKVDPEAPGRVALVTVDRRGHFLQWTATEKVVAAVLPFLGRAVGGPGPAP